MARSNSTHAEFRTYVLRVAKEVRRSFGAVQRDWTVASTVRELGARDGSGNVPVRTRAADEYPESRPEDVAALIRSLDDAIAGLSIVRRRAAERYAELNHDNADREV